MASPLAPALPLYTMLDSGCLAKGLPRPVTTSFHVLTSHTLVLLSPPETKLCHALMTPLTNTMLTLFCLNNRLGVSSLLLTA